jgi:hypothetical protein
MRLRTRGLLATIGQLVSGELSTADLADTCRIAGSSPVAPATTTDVFCRLFSARPYYLEGLRGISDSITSGGAGRAK